MQITNTPNAAVNQRDPEAQLRYQYKRFSQTTKRNLRQKPVMWSGFPTAFGTHQEEVTFPAFRLTGRYGEPATRQQLVDRANVTVTQSFYASLDTLDALPGYRRGSYYGWGGLQTPDMVHGFVAPFEPRNAALLVNSVHSLDISLRGEEAHVLLDKLLEEGCEPGVDYELIKSSNYIHVLSRNMRTVLQSHIASWLPFDMVFSVEVQLAAPFTFTLEAS